MDGGRGGGRESGGRGEIRNKQEKRRRGGTRRGVAE